MTCAELRELAAAFALGALEPEERAEVERHLASSGPHEGCVEAVDRARATAVELAHALPEVKPDRAVWSAIAARLGAGRARSWARVGPVGWAAVAAAAVALLFLQLERMESSRRRDEASQARALADSASAERERLRAELRQLEGTAALQRDALALLDRPGTRLVPLAPQPGQTGRAVALLNLAEGRTVIAASSLPPETGKVYQLWVIRGAAPPRPAGFMQPTAGASAAGEIDRALLQEGPPDALAVSLEPAGGSPSPTQVVLVGRVAG
jgi:anti-sigma-K factor RskA